MTPAIRAARRKHCLAENLVSLNLMAGLLAIGVPITLFGLQHIAQHWAALGWPDQYLTATKIFAYGAFVPASMRLLAAISRIVTGRGTVGCGC